MSDKSAKHLTLRELFTAAEHQSRELVNHLDLNFTPKVDALAKLVRVRKESDPRARVSDLSVRNQAAQVIESERYTAQLYARLEEYVQAIDASVDRILDEDSEG